MKFIHNELLLIFLTFFYPIHYISYNYTIFPNQIFYLYIGSFLIISFFSKRRSGLLRNFFTLFLFFIAYIICFFVVGVWEYFPGTTNKNIKFQCLNILIIYIFFTIGYSFTFDKLYKSLYKVSVLYIIIFIASYLIDKNTTRLGYAPVIGLFLPFLWSEKNYLIIFLVGLTSVSSNSISVVIIFFSSTFFYLLLNYKECLLGCKKWNFSVFQWMKFCGKKIFSIALILFISLNFFYQRIINTFDRFLNVIYDVHSGDHVRAYLNSEAVMLLQESKFLGIGYMNFYEYSKIDPRFQSFLESVGATTNQGVNLHNSYMTWSLEGGVLVIAAVTLILGYSCYNLATIYKINNRWGAVLGSSFFSLLVFGLMHQVHMTPEFWGAIGLIAGFSSSLKSDAH